MSQDDEISIPGVLAHKQESKLASIYQAQATNSDPEIRKRILSAELDIRRARSRLATSQVWGVIAPMLSLTEHHVVLATEGLVFCGSDMKYTLYSLEYVEALKKQPNGRQALAYMVLHEVAHCAFQHHYLSRTGTPNDAHWDWALDQAIAHYIQNSDPTRDTVTPDHWVGCKVNSDYAKLTVKQIYAKAKQDKSLNLTGYQVMHFKNVSDHQKSQLQEMVRSSIAAARLRGLRSDGKPGTDMGGGDDLLFEQAQAKVPWQKLVLNHLDPIFTPGYDQQNWTRLNHRYRSMGMIMPLSYSQEVGGLLVEVDVSGSALHALGQFMSDLQELVLALRPRFVTILYVTTVVMATQHFTPDVYANLRNLLEPKGNGGTDMRAMYQWYTNPNLRTSEFREMEYAAMIGFTDGETPWPTPEETKKAGIPVFWILERSNVYSRDSSTLPPPGAGLYFELDTSSN